MTDTRFMIVESNGKLIVTDTKRNTKTEYKISDLKSVKWNYNHLPLGHSTAIIAYFANQH